MEVYKRYASREHGIPLLGTNDEQYQHGEQHRQLDPSKQQQNEPIGVEKRSESPEAADAAAQDGDADADGSGIRLNLLLAQPGSNTYHHKEKPTAYDGSFKSNLEWLKIFPHAAYFTGEDSFFGHIIIMVYENPKTNKTCTTSFTQFGSITYENLILDARSRFWPSCENLLPIYQKSNVRRALAITNLKNYNRLANSSYGHIMKSHWDETIAGNLANNMSLITEQKPFELGLQILEMGLLQQHTVSSLVLDIVYDNTPSETNSNIIEENNKMVFLLGSQLDQLFDPLLEYSPEVLEFIYRPPSQQQHEQQQKSHQHSATLEPVIATIIDELLTVQTNYTMGLVSLLQDFIIPLRIHVLSVASNAGISKINQVFPPTIDEVTRINCILLDSLVKASKFGVLELFKALGMILPYFYKPFIRHEANLKQFASKLNRFHNKNAEKIFDNESVNKGKYTTREIDSIVCGTLLELSKLKLIISRLFEAVQLSTTNTHSNEFKKIEYYYNAVIEVVNAFGYDEQTKQEKIINKKRIFTPTGKILSEVASNWPIELQYGWITRKVVGIFELQNVKPRFENEIIDVLIIFSDHLLFLSIKDNDYTTKMNNQRLASKKNAKGNTSVKMLSISDVLMHAMVNEKPLPDTLPHMEVNCWCDINEAIVSSYTSGDNEEFLRFFITSNNGFRDQQSCDADGQVRGEVTFNKNYKVLSKEIKPSSGVKTSDSSSVIIELINKAKILNKSQPFHLFKTLSKNDLTMYSTAHEASVYDSEKCKSPFVLFLNLTPKQIGNYFNHNKDLFMILNASFINEHQIQVEGYNRIGSFQLNEIIESKYFKSFVLEAITKGYTSYINFYNEAVRQNLIQSYNSDIQYYLTSFVNRQFATPAMTSTEDDARSIATRKSNMNVSMVHSIPDVYVDKYLETSNRPKQVKRTNEDRIGLETKPQEKESTVDTPPLKKRKVSFFRKLFGGLFKKGDNDKRQTKRNPPGQPLNSSIKRKPELSEQPNQKEAHFESKEPVATRVNVKPPRPEVTKEVRLPSQISSIEVRKSDVPEVDHLYQPNPTIKRHSNYSIPPPEVEATRDPSIILQNEQVRHEENIKSNRTSLNRISQFTDHSKKDSIIPEVSTIPTTLHSADIPQRIALPQASTNDTAIRKQQSKPSRPADITIPQQSDHQRSKYTIIQPEVTAEVKAGEQVDVTAQPYRGPYSIKSSNDSRSILSRKHRSWGEENVLVLDGLHSYSYRTRLNKLLDSDFSNAFQKDLYTDGESNWTRIERENSSLLNAEINALKEDANMDTEDVIDIESMYSDDIRKPSGSTSRHVSDGSTLEASDNSNSYQQRILSGQYYPSADSSKRILSGTSALSNQITNSKRDISVTSLTSSQIMEEFEKEIDSKFAHLDIIAEDSYYEDSNDFDFQSVKPVDEVSHRPIVDVRRISNSTEEEFYSTDEFEQAVRAAVHERTAAGHDHPKSFAENALKDYQPQSNHGHNPSVSSETTIINENNNATVTSSGDETEKKLELAAANSNGGSVDQLLNEFQNPESTSYLSELLEGTLNFDYDTEEDDGFNFNTKKKTAPAATTKTIPTKPKREDPPVFQSPSLIYLASYIRSGMTIRKDMNRIVTGESVYSE